MTANQIAYAKVAEENRHNQEMEKLQSQSNAITSEHYSKSDDYTKKHYENQDKAGLISANANAMNAETTKEHYNKSDAYTQEHYEKSDAANLISANATALNADTKAKEYKMAYDIEYNWSGDFGFPTGMPLTAQQKNVDLENSTLINPVFPVEYGDQWVIDASGKMVPRDAYSSQHASWDIHTSPKLIQTAKENTLKIIQEGASITQGIGQTIFGRNGVLNAILKIVN